MSTLCGGEGADGWPGVEGYMTKSLPFLACQPVETHRDAHSSQQPVGEMERQPKIREGFEH